MNEEKKKNTQDSINLNMNKPTKKVNNNNKAKMATKNNQKKKNIKTSNNSQQRKKSQGKQVAAKKTLTKENKIIKKDDITLKEKEINSKKEINNSDESKEIKKTESNTIKENKEITKETIVLPTRKDDNQKKKEVSISIKTQEKKLEEKPELVRKDNELSLEEKVTTEDKKSKEKETEQKEKIQEKDKNAPKKVKSPKAKKEVLKETAKKLPNEAIVIKDKNNDKLKNFKQELKDINNNNEFAKAIFQSNNISAAIEEEEQNQEKLQNEIDELLVKERKYNFLEPFIFIIVLILCLLGLYVILFTKDSAIISSLLNNISTEMTTNLKNINAFKEDINKGIEVKASLETTNLEYSNLKSYQYIFNLSTKDGVYNGNGTISQNDKEYKVDYTYLDNSLYVKVPDYYYPIKIDNPYSLNPLNINYNGLNNNIEVLKNYLINNIKYSSSKKSKQEIDGKKLNVLNIYFSKDELNEGLKTLKDSLKNDSEFRKSLAKNLGISDDLIVNILNKEFNFEKDLVLSIYTKGLFQEFSGFTVKADEKNIVEYFISNDTKSLYINGEKKINITKTNDKILVYIDDMKLIDIKYSDNKDKTWDFQVSNIINNYQGSLVVKEIDSTSKQVIFSIKNTNKSEQNMEITMNVKGLNNFKEGIDLTDAVSIYEITDEDKDNIWNTFNNFLWNQEEESIQ